MPFPGSAGAPVHLGGGFRIENMDNLPLTLVGVTMGVVSIMLSVAALTIGVVALVRVNTLIALQRRIAARQKAQ